MIRKIISTQNAPAPIGPYSQAIKTHDYLFISGQLPVAPSTGSIVGENITEQATQSLENIKNLLEAAESSLAKVVKTTIFLSDLNDFAEVNRIYGKYFTQNQPARCCVQVAKLPLNAKVEIDVVALV